MTGTAARAEAAPRSALLARADTLLGRMPMYRLLLWALLALAAVALVEAALGLLDLPVGALLAGLVVAVGVSWLAGKALGAIARVTTHTSSNLITGLLLFFLVLPSTAPIDLLALAGACIVAAASKLLLVVGGRHVLNPAAFGAFVLGLTGLSQGVTWWVGSPVLLPFVAVASLLVLIRVRFVGPALLFVVVAAALQVVGQVLYGAAPADALWLAVGSTPIVFLAGTMLDEPFTLPPRRWQRMLEAVVVALVFVLPYFVPLHLGTLGPSPQLAVLVGNLLVLALARPAAARMRFAGRRPLTATSTEFSFRPERPLRHAAGQYLELQLAHRDADRRGIRRTLTIVSPPGEPSGEVRVALRTTDPRSSFKRALDALPIGSPLRAATVSGGFTLPKDRSVPLLLVASGIGITPFVSQLQEELRLVEAGARPRDVVLVDRVPSPDDIPYVDVLEASGVRVLLVTPEPQTLAGVGLPEQWHVTDRFDAETLRGVLDEPERRLAYVSGSPSFVARARRVLRGAGVRRIRTDAFAGY
jgi:glycine betaine catabolism B